MSFFAIWSEQAKMELAFFRLDYEGKDAGLGDRFAESAFQIVHGLESHPRMYAVLNRKGARIAPITPFPFGVLYRVTRERRIRIVGIIPLRSNPRNWRNRG